MKLWWLPRVSGGENRRLKCKETHTASMLNKIEIKYRISTSVETRGKKLTFFYLVVIGIDFSIETK